jgi:hypothetical protein
LCKQIELFERASRFEGSTRERIVALGEAEELLFRLHPHHYRALQTIRIASQLGRTVTLRDDPVRRCESRLISLLMGVLIDAIAGGDLKLHDGQRPSELAFTLWSLAFGMRALMNTSVATRQLGITDGSRVNREATDLLLDALGWLPLSTEHDFDAVRSRVREVLIAPEWEALRSKEVREG